MSKFQFFAAVSTTSVMYVQCVIRHNPYNYNKINISIYSTLVVCVKKWVLRAQQFPLYARRTLRTSFKIRVLQAGVTKCQIYPARGEILDLYLAPVLAAPATYLLFRDLQMSSSPPP